MPTDPFLYSRKLSSQQGRGGVWWGQVYGPLFRVLLAWLACLLALGSSAMVRHNFTARPPCSCRTLTEASVTARQWSISAAKD